MSNNTKAEQVQAAAAGIINVWTANPDFKLKDFTLAALQQDIADLGNILKELKQKDDEMTPLRNQRDDLAVKINASCTRVRAGIKGYFGANSSEYELAGGTRASEIKKGGRSPKPAPAK